MTFTSASLPTGLYESFEQKSINLEAKHAPSAPACDSAATLVFKTRYNDICDLLRDNDLNEIKAQFDAEKDPLLLQQLKKLVIYSAFEYKKIDSLKQLVKMGLLELHDFEKIYFDKKHNLSTRQVIEFLLTLLNDKNDVGIIYKLLSETKITEMTLSLFNKKVISILCKYYTEFNSFGVSHRMYFAQIIWEYITTLPLTDKNVIVILKQILSPQSIGQTVSLLSYLFYTAIDEHGRFWRKLWLKKTDLQTNPRCYLSESKAQVACYMAEGYTIPSIVDYMRYNPDVLAAGVIAYNINNIKLCFDELMRRLYPNKRKKVDVESMKQDFRNSYLFIMYHNIQLYYFVNMVDLNREFDSKRLAVAVLRLRQVEKENCTVDPNMLKEDKVIIKRFQLIWEERGYLRLGRMNLIQIILELYTPRRLLKPLQDYINGIYAKYKTHAQALSNEIAEFATAADLLPIQKSIILVKLCKSMNAEMAKCNDKTYIAALKAIDANLRARYSSQYSENIENKAINSAPIESKAASFEMKTELSPAFEQKDMLIQHPLLSSSDSFTRSGSQFFGDRGYDAELIINHLTAKNAFERISASLEKSAFDTISYKKRLIINAAFAINKIELLKDLIINFKLSIIDFVANHCTACELQPLLHLLLADRNGIKILYDFLRNEKLQPIVTAETNPYQALRIEQQESSKRAICAYLRKHNTFKANLLSYLKSLPKESNNEVIAALYGVFNTTINSEKNIHNLLTYVLCEPFLEDGRMPRPYMPMYGERRYFKYLSNGVVSEYFFHLVSIVFPHCDLQFYKTNNKQCYEKTMQYLQLVYLNRDLPFKYETIEWASFVSSCHVDEVAFLRIRTPEEYQMYKSKVAFVESTWLQGSRIYQRYLKALYLPRSLLQPLEELLNAYFIKNKPSIKTCLEKIETYLWQLGFLNKHNRPDAASKLYEAVLSLITAASKGLKPGSPYKIVLDKVLGNIRWYYDCGKNAEYASSISILEKKS